MTKEPVPNPLVIEEDELEIVIEPGQGSDERIQVQAAEGPPIPDELPILPLRGRVLFPGTVVPLTVGRDKSKRLIDDTLPARKIIGAVCQRDANVENPVAADLHACGTALLVLKLLRTPDGNQSIVVQGLRRIRIRRWLAFEPFIRAEVEALEDILPKSTETEALAVGARNTAARIIQLSPSIPDEAMMVVNSIEQPGALADFLVTNLSMDAPMKQELLEELDVDRRLKRVGAEMQRQLEVLELSEKIQVQVRASIDKSQREYYLQEQLKAIRKELGQVDEKAAEIDALRKRIEAAGMGEGVLVEVKRELGRLEAMPTASPEYHMIRTYLDIMAELPWRRSSEDRLDMERARKVLDEDHYDLEPVKRRILEYLAVRKLAPDSRGPILCFVGPPGVGKTSLGQSIARALGRKFLRMSLGGMRDEAELRGHRRTYIGAMPGRIIQEIRKAGARNPVFMLDEVDKVGADFRGDPTSALLEVLDPAQNGTFQDHYLNVPFDLSQVMFIATANYMAPVPPALRDRMEVLELSGYAHTEKLQIAMKYLVGRQLSANGLAARQAKWTEKAVLRIIDEYTREAGVRELERQIGSVCRAIASLVASGKARSRTVNPRLVRQMLGPRKYESEVALRTSTPGVATGLAFTPAGGVIVFIEAAGYPGKGALMLTGHIGDVMRESAQAAFSLVKSRLSDKKIPAGELAATDIHVHLPAGATPKDGPSAGVALFTALTSLLTDTPVRSDVAMTGEVTLRGLVLPVGGIKEKVLAARRAGIGTVILPRRNAGDLEKLPADARSGMCFVSARTVDDVLSAALAPRGPARRRSR